MIINAIAKINQLLAELCGVLLSIMIVILCLDIAGRSTNAPLQGVAELAVFVMVSAIYLGLAQCEQLDKHVKVTVLFEKMPLGLKQIFRVINNGIQVTVVTILIWAAWTNFVYTYIGKVAIAGTMPLLLWPVNLVILLGLFFYWLQCIINLIHAIRSFSTSYFKMKGTA